MHPYGCCNALQGSTTNPIHAKSFTCWCLPPLPQVKKMAYKIERGLWSTPSDALDFVSSLKDLSGCYVKWETDAHHRLKSVIWATTEQQILAREFGGVVIQDNTCMTTKWADSNPTALNRLCVCRCVLDEPGKNLPASMPG